MLGNKMWGSGGGAAECFLFFPSCSRVSDPTTLSQFSSLESTSPKIPTSPAAAAAAVVYELIPATGAQDLLSSARTRSPRFCWAFS